MKRAAAFLSWSTADSRIEPLAELFKSWLYALFQGEIDFFFSREIEPGEAAITSVYEVLNAADLGFVFLSQRTARSPWVVFESGCLNPSLRKGKVFPLLFDLSVRELRVICPPLAEFQAVSLRSRDDVRRLVDKVCRLIGLEDTEHIAVRERFHQSFDQLEQAIRAKVDSKRVLPDRFAGTIAYKKIPLLADTFWFVDPDNTNLTGDMLFSLMTISTGRGRPVYYVNQRENPELYAKHFDMCQAAYDLSSDVLWPTVGQ